jgi:S-disulfanyl-L-cysteine oxidoreductase SoxD
MKRLLVLALPFTLASSLSASPQYFAKTMWDGVFTSADAVRGQSDYLQMCSSCHGADLKGNGAAPALTGPAFFERWRDLSVFDLFFAAEGKMDAASDPLVFDFRYMPPALVRDIVSYILEVNGASAGSELPTDFDQLRQIEISPKAGQ